MTKPSRKNVAGARIGRGASCIQSGIATDQTTARGKQLHVIIIKCLDPLRAKKIFIRKKLGHTAVSAIKAPSVTL